MSDYRINVRFHEDVPAEQAAVEFLKSLKGSRNRFVVEAVIAHMEKDTLLENIRQMFREELSGSTVHVSVPSAGESPMELTEAQEAENRKNVLADLDLFG